MKGKGFGRQTPLKDKESTDLYPLISDRLVHLIEQSIQAGEGDELQLWAGLDALRKQHGRGVYCPIMTFNSQQEAQNFIDFGTWPETAAEGFGGCYVDTGDSLDAFLEMLNSDVGRDRLEPFIRDLLEEVDGYWEFFQPILTSVALWPKEKGSDRRVMGWAKNSVVWWASESEAVAFPDITRDWVEDYLDKSKQARVLRLNPRNPLHAGNNINIWMEAAKEREMAVCVEAETNEGLKHLTPSNRANTLTIPLKGEAA